MIKNRNLISESRTGCAVRMVCLSECCQKLVTGVWRSAEGSSQFPQEQQGAALRGDGPGDRVVL